jgi:hypothetical protein
MNCKNSIKKKQNKVKFSKKVIDILCTIIFKTYLLFQSDHINYDINYQTINKQGNILNNQQKNLSI